MNIKRKRGLVVAVALLSVAGLIWLVMSNPPVKSADSLMAEARQLQEKGDLDHAFILAKNALQQDPTRGEARFLMGQLFKQKGEPRGAEHHFREALNLKYPP